MFCIDAEILKSPPITSPIPLVAENHTLIKERDRCRVYKLSLMAGESVDVCYPFFYLSIVLRGSKIKTSIRSAGHSLFWEQTKVMGDEEWCTPAIGITIKNLGDTTYEQFIAEWK
jgi:hypothetical protein